MEERLKELKEKITSFIEDYDIEEFNVYINYREVQQLGGEKRKADRTITIGIDV